MLAEVVAAELLLPALAMDAPIGAVGVHPAPGGDVEHGPVVAAALAGAHRQAALPPGGDAGDPAQGDKGQGHDAAVPPAVHGAAGGDILQHKVGGLVVVMDVPIRISIGDVVVKTLCLFGGAGQAAGQLGGQRPQVGGKDDVGGFLAGVETGLVRVGGKAQRVGIAGGLGVAVPRGEAAVLGQVRLPEGGALGRVRAATWAGGSEKCSRQRSDWLSQAAGRGSQARTWTVCRPSALALASAWAKAASDIPTLASTVMRAEAEPSRSIFSWVAFRRARDAPLSGSGTRRRAAKAGSVASSVSSKRSR